MKDCLFLKDGCYSGCCYWAQPFVDISLEAFIPSSSFTPPSLFQKARIVLMGYHLVSPLAHSQTSGCQMGRPSQKVEFIIGLVILRTVKEKISMLKTDTKQYLEVSANQSQTVKPAAISSFNLKEHVLHCSESKSNKSMAIPNCFKICSHSLSHISTLPWWWGQPPWIVRGSSVCPP